MESKHLIIGAGEIGRSVYEVLKDVADVSIRDIDSDIVGQFNYVHITFPYTDNFVELVRGYEELYSPHTIIVHTTTKIGTIRNLGEKAVHVPIRGKHPNLAQSIKTFRLYIGGNDIDRVTDVAAIFKQVVPDVYILDQPPETTEALKILSTTYYGWNIIFEKWAHDFCERYEIPFEVVYTDANKSYNEGYTKMGMPQFVRPVLEHMPGCIGGHCVRQNCDMMPEESIPEFIIYQDECNK